jgi:hypothetical protein
LFILRHFSSFLLLRSLTIFEADELSAAGSNRKVPHQASGLD